MTFSPTALPDGPFAEIHAYWQSRREGEALPSWNSFDILDVAPLIPGLTVFDVNQTEADVRIRFVGTRIIEAQGADTTGINLSQIPELAQVRARCLDAAKTGQPYFVYDETIQWTSKTFKTYSALGLPLASDGKCVDKIVFLMTFS